MKEKIKNELEFGFKFKLGVFIGRFQPFHEGHLYSIVEALRHCHNVLVLIGSVDRARNIRNPWTYQERVELIQTVLKNYDREHQSQLAQRVFFSGLKDYLYQENLWSEAVRENINKILPKISEQPVSPKQIAVVGFEKDDSTYYLKLFPEYARLPIKNFKNIHSTVIRKAYFLLGETLFDGLVMKETAVFLKDFLENSATKSEYLILKKEYELIQQYQEAWSHTPYPPIFTTTDALVLCQGHILLIQRKHPPGQNLWAFPGGFLNVNERIETGIIRELVEETQIQISNQILAASLKKCFVFDHPERSQVGRVITHVGVIILELPECPAVHAADDAKQVQWWKLEALAEIEAQMHDDHYQISKLLVAQAIVRSECSIQDG